MHKFQLNNIRNMSIHHLLYPENMSIRQLSITFYFFILDFSPFNKTMQRLNKNNAGQRAEKQQPGTIHKRDAPKGLAIVEDFWKHSSKMVRSPSAIMPKSPKEIVWKSKLNVPGPGHYDFQRLIRQEKHFDFKLTRFNTDTPSKNSENIGQNHKRTRKNSVSVCINDSNHINRDFLYHDGQQGITFPKETRENMHKISNRDKHDSPGPGKYKEFQRKSSKNIFSFSKTKKFIQEEKELSQKGSYPAPGKYELSQSRKQLRGSKFTQAVRMVTQQTLIPGPGSHSKLHQSTLSHQGGTIDRQRKMTLYQTATPGPGKYEKIDINKIKRKQAIPVIGKSKVDELKATSLIVGPGYYFKEKLLKKEKILGGTIDRSLRNTIHTQMGPGPQDYSVNFAPVLSKSKEIVFAKQDVSPTKNKVLIRFKKESNLINDLRQSSSINNRPIDQKRHQRCIHKTTLGHY